MRELVGGKNTIGRTAAVLKSPIKRPLTYLFYFLCVCVCVCVVFCVGSGLCDELIIRSEEFYQVCDCV